MTCRVRHATAPWLRKFGVGARRLARKEGAGSCPSPLGDQEPGEALELLPVSRFHLGKKERRPGARSHSQFEGAGSCPSPLGEKELEDVPKSFPFSRVHLGKKGKGGQELGDIPNLIPPFQGFTLGRRERRPGARRLVPGPRSKTRLKAPGSPGPRD